MYTKKDWNKASDYCIYNKNIILKSKNAACYCCVNHFKASMVTEFVDNEDTTALCPLCGVDAVLGDATGLPIENVEYLQAMHALGFGTCFAKTNCHT